MPLIAFVLLAIICLALIGFVCACLGEDSAQAIARAVSITGDLAPVVEVWALVIFLGMSAQRAATVMAAPGRASPQLLQRFLL